MTTLPHNGQHRLRELVRSSRSIATLITRPVTRSPIRLMTGTADPGTTASEGIPRRRSPTSSTHTSDLGAGSRSARHLQAHRHPGSRFPTSLTADQPGEPTHRLPRRSRSEFTLEYHPPSTYSRPTPLAGELYSESAGPTAHANTRRQTRDTRREVRAADSTLSVGPVSSDIIPGGRRAGRHTLRKYRHPSGAAPGRYGDSPTDAHKNCVRAVQAARSSCRSYWRQKGCWS